MVRFSEKQLVAFGLLCTGILFAAIAYFTDCSAGGADNYAHFNIARWAFRYPYLFLDHWGKPLYTILVAPFDQMGFFGARLFNVMAGLFTAWLAYLLVTDLKLARAWLAPVFVVFAPMFFVHIFTGMTEILFSTVLLLSVFLFFREKYILSAIALSFIILVRSEGFVFMPLFFVAFLLKKRYLAIPFLAFGFVLFGVIGWLYHYHSFWWLITKLPYVGGEGGIYGSGSWYHFLEKMPDYLGYFILVFFLAGMVYWLRNWLVSQQKFASQHFYALWLIAGCFWIYLAAHSYVWWKGEMSLGLLRVMAGVSPLAGIIALSGWNEVISLVRNMKVRNAFLGVSVLLIVVPGVLRYKSEFKTNSVNVLINEVVSWLKKTKNFDNHLVVHDPYIAFAAEVDAWDQSRLQYGFSDVNAPEKSMPDGSVFIWDAHFSQNEGRMPAKLILENPYYELIGYFEPEIPFKVLNGYDYNIMVFKKVSARTKDNFELLEQLKSKITEPNLVYSESFDFEKPKPERVPEAFRKATGDSVQGHCFALGADCEFSPSVLIGSDQVRISNKMQFVVQLDVRTNEPIQPKELLMVCSVEKDDKSYFYQAEDIQPFAKNESAWNKASFKFTMPEDVKSGTKIKLYVWNVGRKRADIDNFKIQVFEGK